MIDTYFDRVDAAQGYKFTPSQPISEDPRYWGGQLYATVIDRQVAEARATLRWVITNAARWHKAEMAHGIRLGDSHSFYTAAGVMK